MQTQTGHKRWTAFAAAVAAGAIGCGDLTTDTTPVGAGEPSVETKQGAVTAVPSRALDPKTRFFIPAPNPGAVQQVVDLVKARKLVDAARITAMEATPSAVWFTDGTPDEVKAAVRKTVKAAALLKTVPVLVAYNVPYRDCAQYSAGGATDTAAYKAWIDAFADGIGSAHVVVILEPDGLGIIPNNKDVWGTPEWCQPVVTDANGNKVLDADGNPIPQPGATPADRYAQINYAVDSINARAASAAVYLDSTHSGWLGANEAAYRLNLAGVARAAGFLLNISHYQRDSENQKLGTWVSSCLAMISGYAAGGQAWWQPSWGCPNQYVETPAGSGNWLPTYTPENIAAVDTAYASALAPGWIGPFVPATHFVVDTSRSGRGPLDTTPYGASPYNQSAATVKKLHDGNWCNPPGAGLGVRPTANTGVALLDANLWVKVPGESDGSCDIQDDGSGPRAWDFTVYNPWGVAPANQNHFDMLWGMVDPAAGAWFPQQALQLAQNATPPLF
jgi:endoglucanase